MDSFEMIIFGEVVDLKIDEIVVDEDRLRDTSSDDEDLEQLKIDIKKNGLLQNIVVNQNKKLVSGYRRLQCCKELGHETIWAIIINTEGEEHERLIELSENVNRKNFTYSDLMKAADELHSYVEEKSEERKSSKEPSKFDIPGLPPMSGRTSEIMAKILSSELIGSGKTYERARKIWQKDDSEDKRTIIDELDSGNIAVFSALRQLEAAEKERSAGSGDGNAGEGDNQDDSGDEENKKGNGDEEKGNGDEHDDEENYNKPKVENVTDDPLNYAKKVVEAFETLVQNFDVNKYEPNQIDETIAQLEDLTNKMKEARSKMQQTT